MERVGERVDPSLDLEEPYRVCEFPVTTEKREVYPESVKVYKVDEKGSPSFCFIIKVPCNWDVVINWTMRVASFGLH